ncbi:MAG: hypothetical protein ABI743_11355 [bacterium]
MRWRPIAVGLTLFTLGCAHADPVGPATVPPVAVAASSLGVAPLVMRDITISDVGGSLTATLDPVREAGAELPLGTTALVDVMGYVHGALACHDCLKVMSVERVSIEEVAVTFGLRHPFPASSARWDLHLFDVKGYIAGDRLSAAFPEFEVDLGGPAPEGARVEQVLENPDGFNSFYDGVVLPSLGESRSQINLRPFKYFWRDDTPGNWAVGNPNGFADLAAPIGHNVFPVGGQFSDPRAQTTYRFLFPPDVGGTLKLRLTIEAAYAKTAPNGQAATAKYFLPLFNDPAPSWITATTITNELQAGDSGSSILMDIAVADWQGNALVLDDPSEFDFATSSLDSTPWSSEPEGLQITVPGLFDGAINRTLIGRFAGEGPPDDPYIWRQELFNTNGAGEGTYFGLLKARDNTTGRADQNPLIVERDGVTLSSWNDHTTYQLIRLEVGPLTNRAPTADIMPDRTEIFSEESVQFCPGPGTTDPDGNIVTWEYDFDYDSDDPLTFVADATRTSADPDQCVDHVFSNFGQPFQLVYTVGMRVTDDGTPTRHALDSVKIFVDP